MKGKRPAAGSTPIMTKGFGARYQIDLKDMQSMPSAGGYKYILNLQDHGIKLFDFRCLKDRTAKVGTFV